MANEQALQQAVAAIKAGDKKTGGKILHDLLKLDRDNEAAWLWMSACVETDGDRRYCLEQALRVNPNNENAKRGLARLAPKPQSAPPAPAPTSAPPQPQEDAPFSFSQITASAGRSTPGPDPAFDGQAPKLPDPDPVFTAPDQPAPGPEPAFTPPPAQAPSSPATAGAVPPKTNKSSKTIATILIAISALCLLCVICGLIGTELIKQNAQRAAGTIYDVEYRVTAQQGVTVLVAYSDAGDQMHELQLNRYPWSAKYPMNGTTIAAVSATNASPGQSVTCEILVNGKVKVKVSASDKKPALCMAVVGE